LKQTYRYTIKLPTQGDKVSSYDAEAVIYDGQLLIILADGETEIHSHHRTLTNNMEDAATQAEYDLYFKERFKNPIDLIKGFKESGKKTCFIQRSRELIKPYQTDETNLSETRDVYYLVKMRGSHKRIIQDSSGKHQERWFYSDPQWTKLANE
jgi:hypothetical protein